MSWSDDPLEMKPHRLILGSAGWLAAELEAFRRRRRLARQPFARVHYADGRGATYGADSPAGRALFRAAASLIDAAER